MKIYHVICTTTLPETSPSVTVEASFKMLREAEEYFARTMEMYENDVMYDWDLDDDTFVAHSRFSNITYYYKIHASEVK